MTVGASSVLAGSVVGSGTWLPEPLASRSAMSAVALRRAELDPPRRTSERDCCRGMGRCVPVDPAAGGGAPSGVFGPAAAGWLAVEGRVGSGDGFGIRSHHVGGAGDPAGFVTVAARDGGRK